MSRVKILIATFILAIALLFVEVVLVRTASSYEPKTPVVYAKKKIAAKSKITAGQLEIKMINLSLAHKQSYRSLRQLEGKSAKVDIEASEMVLSSRVESTGQADEIKVLDKNNRLFTIEFKGDQANGWQVREGQHVDILYVPNEKTWRTAGGIQQEIQGSDDSNGIRYNSQGVGKIRNIRVAAVMDEKGKIIKSGDNTSIPRYISFEVNGWQDAFLAYAKGNGRLELSVIPESRDN